MQNSCHVNPILILKFTQKKSCHVNTILICKVHIEVVPHDYSLKNLIEIVDHLQNFN